jgi:hypothetical protein
MGLALLFAAAAGGCSSDPPATVDMSMGPCNGVPMTGRCLDSTTVATCVAGSDDMPRLVQNSCGVGYTCVSEPTQAYCKLTATCREGQSRCTSSTTREVCDKSAWQSMTCPGAQQCSTFPGLGAACVLPGINVVVQGTLRFERRVPNSTLTGYTAPAAAPAPGVFVEVVDGSEVLGTGFTDSNGQFAVGAYRPPSATAKLVFVPIAFFPDDSPAYGVAIPKDKDTVNTSLGMWSFSSSNLPAAVGGVINTGTQTVTAEDSGAINIFTWMAAHFARVTTLFGRAPAQSVIALWTPNVDMFCLACFINRAGGGTYVGGGTLPLHFDNTILLSGTTGSPLQWSASVINHEIGHFIMHEYGQSPGEGGVHYLNMPEAPGLAWSEGYATWAGQAALSVGLATPNPRYFTRQQGTTFYIDISNVTSSAGMIPLPNPNGPIDQDIGEIAVAAIAWDLWRTAGDAAISTSLALPRVTSSLNRGYKTLDLVDFADAALCGGRATSAQVTSSMTKFRFPWDNNPLCP